MLIQINQILNSRDSVSEQSGLEAKLKIMELGKKNYKKLCEALCDKVIEFDNEIDYLNKKFYKHKYLKTK